MQMKLQHIHLKDKWSLDYLLLHFNPRAARTPPHFPPRSLTGLSRELPPTYIQQKQNASFMDWQSIPREECCSCDCLFNHDCTSIILPSRQEAASVTLCHPCDFTTREYFWQAKARWLTVLFLDSLSKCSLEKQSAWFCETLFSWFWLVSGKKKRNLLSHTN